MTKRYFSAALKFQRKKPRDRAEKVALIFQRRAEISPRHKLFLGKGLR